MPNLLEMIANGTFSDLAVSPIQPLTSHYNVPVENPGDVDLDEDDKAFFIELARRQGGQPQYVETNTVARTDCVPYVYSEESAGTLDDLKQLMEHRCFNTVKLSRNKAIFERHDGDIYVVVRLKDNRVVGGSVRLSRQEYDEEKQAYTPAKTKVLNSWRDVYSIAQAYGD